MVTPDDYESWQKIEERFASLVRLGGDERTPDHERSAACRAAVAMFKKGDMEVVSAGRWASLMMLYRNMLLQVGVPRLKCSSENVLGRNGWKCCQCGAIQMSLWIFIGFSRARCGRCGHQRCDEVSSGGIPEPEGP